jgi:predicted amidohydrolase YtcJ
MSQEVLLKNGLIITVDETLGDLQDADVLIRDGVIVAVGSGVSTASADAEVIDCKGRLVIPGLVDTHRHVLKWPISSALPQTNSANRVLRDAK